MQMQMRLAGGNGVHGRQMGHPLLRRMGAGVRCVRRKRVMQPTHRYRPATTTLCGRCMRQRGWGGEWVKRVLQGQGRG
jgi:hypothetical protein